MAKKNIHVVPKNDGWVVRKEGNVRPTSLHQTQKEAVSAARMIARKHSGELLIHGRDGRIRERDSYSADPFAPRDREVLFPNKPGSASKKAIKDAVSSVIGTSKTDSKDSSRSSKRH